MIYEYEFFTEEQKHELILQNKDKYIVATKYLLNGNFLVFSNTPTVEVLQQEQGEKISALELESQALREELTQIQTSINSLTSLIAVTLEEK